MLSDFHKKNLDTLATYLEGLPADYQDFNMSSYLEVRGADGYDEHKAYRAKQRKYALENGGVGECGSVACAVGHGPAAKIFFNEDELGTGDDEYFGTLRWQEYVERCFCPIGYDGGFHDAEEFYWMFSGNWASYDNTPHGAAARIRYVLAGREIPDLTRVQWTKEFHNPELYAEYRK